MGESKSLSFWKLTSRVGLATIENPVSQYRWLKIKARETGARWGGLQVGDYP